MMDEKRPSSMYLLLAIVIVIIVAVVMVAMMLALSSPYGYGMMGGMGYGGAPLLVAIVLVVAIIVIVLIILLARSNDSPYAPYRFPPPQAMTPLQVLEQRYARGELTREQYQQMRSDLESQDQDVKKGT